MKEKLDAQGYPVATQKVSPEALAAFYRQRSESLRREQQQHQNKMMEDSQKNVDTAPAQQVKAQGWIQQIIDVLSLGK